MTAARILRQVAPESPQARLFPDPFPRPQILVEFDGGGFESLSFTGAMPGDRLAWTWPDIENPQTVCIYSIWAPLMNDYCIASVVVDEVRVPLPQGGPVWIGTDSGSVGMELTRKSKPRPAPHIALATPSVRSI